MAHSPPELYSPIARMPAEILTRIFDIHVHDALQRFDRSPSHLVCAHDCSPYSWIRVSHVCKHWRSLSLATPLLWSTIIVTRQTECMQAMLERSQQVPLHVRSIGPGACYISRPVPLKSLRLVLTAMPRIRTLDLAINWWVYDELASLLQQPAPLLRQARLSTPNGGYDGGWLCPVASLGERQVAGADYSHTAMDPDPRVQLPLRAGPQTQTQPQTEIEELSLGCYAFPWSDPHSFRTLKHLRVDSRGLVRPAIEEIAHALGTLTRLVSLTLHGVLHGGSVQTLARAYSGAIVLKDLEQLTLSGDSLTCATILKLLDIPNTVRITLVYTFDKNLDALAYSMPHVNHKLEDRLGHESEPSCLSITHSQSSCSLSFYTTSSDEGSLQAAPGLFAEASQPRLTLKIAPSASNLEAICRQLHSGNMDVLQMTPLPGTEVTAWLPVFTHLRNFREAHLVQWQLADVLQLLSHGGDEVAGVADGMRGDEASEDAALQESKVLLPDLQVLALWDVQNAEADIVADVPTALSSRENHGRRLEKLVLRECTSLSSEDVSVMAQLAECLDWDGLNLHRSS